MHLEDAILAEHRPLTGGYRVLTLTTERIASGVRPGQFVHLLVPGMGQRVLRRPFSVYQAEGNLLSILYKDVGQGHPHHDHPGPRRPGQPDRPPRPRLSRSRPRVRTGAGRRRLRHGRPVPHGVAQPATRPGVLRRGHGRRYPLRGRLRSPGLGGARRHRGRFAGRAGPGDRGPGRVACRARQRPRPRVLRVRTERHAARGEPARRKRRLPGLDLHGSAHGLRGGRLPHLRSESARRGRGLDLGPRVPRRTGVRSAATSCGRTMPE